MSKSEKERGGRRKESALTPNPSPILTDGRGELYVVPLRPFIKMGEGVRG